MLRSAVCPGSTCWEAHQHQVDLCISLLYSSDHWPLRSSPFPPPTQSISIRLFTLFCQILYENDSRSTLHGSQWLRQPWAVRRGPRNSSALCMALRDTHCDTHLQNRLLPSQGLLQASIWRCLFSAPQISALSFFFFANTAGKSRNAFLKLRHLWLLQMLDIFSSIIARANVLIHAFF